MHQAFVKHIEAASQSIDDSLALYQYYLHDFIRNLILPFEEEYIESVYTVSISKFILHIYYFIDPSQCNTSVGYILRTSYWHSWIGVPTDQCYCWCSFCILFD